jgi:hypothetical protein
MLILAIILGLYPPDGIDANINVKSVMEINSLHRSNIL